MATLNRFFEGLRVVELASVLAGPAVGMFFAELGAEVIKIENKKTGGDMTRGWKLPSEDPQSPTSAYYHSINWGKEAILLNLEVEEDRQQALQWIQTADIVISNFKTEAAKRLGMDYESLSAVHPGLIYAQLHAFDENSDLPAFDVVLQAEAGFLYMTGEPDREPVKMPVALIDLLAAHQLKEGVLVALLQRERTGRGSLVSTSLLASAIASLANQAANWLTAGHIPQRMGSQHPNIAPYGDIYYCADGKPVVMAVGTDRQFRQLLDVLQLGALCVDERFNNNAARVANRSELNNRLAQAVKAFNRDELLEQCHARQVPVAGIRDMKEVFEQPSAQRLVLETRYPDGSISRCVKTVVFDIDEGREARI